MCDKTTIDLSESFVHANGAATITGTNVTIPDPQARGNIYASLSVINDTDQDIKVSYITNQGYAGSFIVPKSIKGFTRTLKTSTFDNSTFKVLSTGNSDASGNIIFNFGS